jgi:hypothetical protein
VIDVNKGKTRMATHIYMLLNIDPGTISVQVAEVVVSPPKSPINQKHVKSAGKSILDATPANKMLFKKRKRSDRAEDVAEKKVVPEKPKDAEEPPKQDKTIPMVNLEEDISAEADKGLELVVSNQIPHVLLPAEAMIALESLKYTLAAHDSEVADCTAKNTAIKEEVLRMRHKLEAAELRVKICTRDYNDIFKCKTRLEEANSKAMRDLAEVQNALQEKEALLQEAYELQGETKQSCDAVTTCLAEEYAKLQGELDVARMRLAPYIDEEEEKEVAYLDTTLIPQLEEEQREKIKGIFESHLAAWKEILEKPRGTCRGKEELKNREDPNNDGGAAEKQKELVVRGSQAGVNSLTVAVVPSSSTPVGGDVNAVALSNITYQLDALKL